MPNNEVYRQDPGEKLREVLRACGWRYYVRPQERYGYWEKGFRRLVLDEFGLFLFQFRHTWERTKGLCWELVKASHLRERMIFFTDGYELNLLSEE